ncbi:MAG TPA: deoxyribonuclease IV [Pirellulales bacterium]|nr:deoxyribonuclease IV [Pirellulales bacterium]
MPPLGAHTSIAGGYFRAAERGQAVGCQCIQLFTKNNNQWRAKPITPAEAEQFRAAVANAGLVHPIAHNSYLINLAAPNDELWRRSVDSMVEELERAELLGLEAVVTHPGAYTSTSEQVGLRRVVEALDEIHERTSRIKVLTLLETTAGQGSCLGCKFEHLAEIMTQVNDPGRLGVCIDTCHLFAAGYPLGTRREYLATMRELDAIIGLDQVRAVHLNDSVKPLGSRVDRHAHIGSGAMGLEPFRHLLNDRRFAKRPMYLETPKGEHDGEDWDVTNLRVLRNLIAE